MTVGTLKVRLLYWRRDSFWPTTMIQEGEVTDSDQNNLLPIMLHIIGICLGVTEFVFQQRKCTGQGKC